MAPGIQIQIAQEVIATPKPSFEVQTHEIEVSDLESDDGDLPVPPESKEPVEILELDKDTPDSHVPRDSRLIRLTGVHPFNVEAPLTALYDEGRFLILSKDRLSLLIKCKR
jgi:nitrate reductase (NAD(P)H)